MGPKVDSDENVFVRSMLQDMFSYSECRHLWRLFIHAACTKCEGVVETHVGHAVGDVETERD